MMLVVTCCNQGDGQANILLVDEKAKDVVRVYDYRGIGSCTGIARTGFGWVVGCQDTKHENATLLFLNRHFEEIRRCHLDLVTDIHSLLKFGDLMLCVSSGTDEIIRVKMAGPTIDKDFGEEIRFSFGSGWDQHHMNDLVVSPNGFLMFTCFGKRKTIDTSWREVRDGGLRHSQTKVTTGMKHPHTPAFLLNGQWVLCESAEKRVVFQSGDMVDVGGYARGLCWNRTNYYVGISTARQISKSTGQLLPVDPEDRKAGIVVVHREALKVTETIDLSHLTSEVYSVVMS